MLTRANVESILYGRNKGVIALANFSILVNGTNPDMADPIAEALNWFGLYAANRSAPTDSDLASIVQAQESQLLDVADLRLKRNLLGVLLSIPDQVVQQSERRYSDSMTELRMAIQALEAKIQAQYLSGQGRAEVAQMARPVPWYAPRRWGTW
jgi:hypothetical protein